MAAIRRSGRLVGRPPELSELTGAQLDLVRLVGRRPAVSVAQAAAELRLAANTVSTLVRQLTDAGLLLRRVDPVDRRIARKFDRIGGPAQFFEIDAALLGSRACGDCDDLDRPAATRPRSQPDSLPVPSFVPVRVIPDAVVELILPSGLQLRVPLSADAPQLARLVLALRAPPC